jgi:hypothetical protein
MRVADASDFDELGSGAGRCERGIREPLRTSTEHRVRRGGINAPAVPSGGRIADDDVAAGLDEGACDAVGAKIEQPLLQDVAFPDSAKVQTHAGPQPDRATADVNLDPAPPDMGMSLGELLSIRQASDPPRLSPHLDERAYGYVERSVCGS